MPTYGGWNVISMPATPAAPAAIEMEIVATAAMTRNPFTGQQQVQDWQAQTWNELSVTLPPLSYADAQAWIAFLRALRGVVNVFQFGAAVCAQYANELTGGSPAGPLYFRLKQNSVKYSIGQDRYYRIQFEIIQAF